MMKSLFRPVSPLLGWFLLMELLGAASIVGLWIETLGHERPWQRWGIGHVVLVTILFFGSNILLFRHRRVAVVGLVVAWILLLLMSVPTL